jgi:hypothetical protein
MPTALPAAAAAVATPRARLFLACAATLACALSATGAIAQAGPPSTAPTATRPTPATPGNLTPAEKRCTAGLRRVDRHQQKLAETKRLHEATRKTVENCGSARACEQASHRERTLDARSRNEERQLARLEAEARSLCAVVVPAPTPR